MSVNLKLDAARIVGINYVLLRNSKIVVLRKVTIFYEARHAHEAMETILFIPDLNCATGAYRRRVL